MKKYSNMTKKELIFEIEKLKEQNRSIFIQEQKLESLEKLNRKIIEKAPFGIYLVNAKGIVEYVNPAMLQIAGDKLNKFMKLNMLKLPTYKEIGLVEKIKAGFKGQAFSFGPVQYRSYLGKKLTTRCFTGIPLTVDDTPKLLIIVEDITALKETERELKQSYDMLEEKVRERTRELKAVNIELQNQVLMQLKTEEALRESENRLSVTLDSIEDAVIVTDIHGFISRVNPSAERILSSPQRLVEGVHLHDALPNMVSETSGFFDRLYAETVKKKDRSSSYRTLLLINQDASEQRFEYTAAPIMDSDESIVGLVIVLRNVTESYVLQERLRQAKKLEAIGQLAGGIAHDFNNLLTGIQNCAYLLKERLSEKPDLSKLTETILSTTAIAADITSKLLAYARRGKLREITFDLHAVVNEVITILKHTIDKRIIIHSDFSAQRYSVHGDMSQIQNAILNIALNARDAMSQGGTLSFSTRDVKGKQLAASFRDLHIQDGEYICLEVADTGTGISPEKIQYIFEPFYTTKSFGKGSGLGLAAVYGTIKSHNGFVDVKSVVGEGTTFYLYFPIRNQQELRLEDTIRSRPRSSGHILLVDDDITVLETTASLLQENGYTIEKYSDSMKALNAFNVMPDLYDLVILDMIMPHMSGVDIIMRMKDLKPDVRIIAMTGHSMQETTSTLRTLDVLHVVQKPFNVDTLLSAVNDELMQ